MAITLNGTTGITTPDIDTDGLSVDTNAIFVDPATNNVGIGTSSPTFITSGYQGLHVNAPTATAIKLTNTTTGQTGSNGFDILVSSIGEAYVFNRENTNLVFGTNATERMRLEASGNLLVGTTTGFGKTTVYNAAGVGGVSIATTTNNDAYYALLFKNAANSNVGNINCTVSTTSYATSSDYRLKENVAPMQNALATVAQLKPCTYNWKVDGSSGQGFIAHELQAVVPDCVTGEKDAVDEDGKPQYQGVDTSFLVATLVAAIQEQQTLIQSLTTRIEALEAV